MSGREIEPRSQSSYQRDFDENDNSINEYDFNHRRTFIESIMSRDPWLAQPVDSFVFESQLPRRRFSSQGFRFSRRKGVSPISESTKTTLSELAEESKNATPNGEDYAESESAATPKKLHFPKDEGPALAETVQQGPAPPPLEGWNTGSVEDSANTSVENRIPHSQEAARSNSYSIAVHEAEHSHIEIPSPLFNSYPLHATGTDTSSALALQIEPLHTGLPTTSSLVQHRDDSAAKFICRLRRKIRPCYILLALGVLTIVGSLTPALWRSIDRDDLSGGFTLAQYILGVGVFVVGPIVAIHSKTCTCWQ